MRQSGEGSLASKVFGLRGLRSSVVSRALSKTEDAKIEDP